ncbi:hypothetical protein HO133_009896 [Letharia lupina]|uniref:Uncharacterized protein n=1 Tax=Letharia lupina TaxID=560253 RepID=A0A8H6CM09_9LECA|nr:uncharacterized protein HO133_009896 [Letharia lupina]KAF6225893.1 hypothetical protein HO133_009896 [Letharia lupina]
MSQNFKTIDLQPQPEKPMGAHLRDGDSKDIISEQPSSRKMSMQAEPQVSMRGGGVIGDWYVARHSQLSISDVGERAASSPTPSPASHAAELRFQSSIAPHLRPG